MKITILLLSLLTITPGFTADWTQWRGPARDGLISAAPWPDSLAGLTETWTVPLGPSYSGPIVSEKAVFVTETADKKNEVVRALDRKTGKELWQTSWEGAMKVPFFARSNGSWIRATPTLDENRLYVAGMKDVLVCLNAENGEEIWKVDFVERYQGKLPAFGFVCSPLIVGEHLYVQAGGGFCKLNKRTGKEVWRSLVDGGGMFGSAFASPVHLTLHGKPQLVVQTRVKLAGVGVEDGKELWSQKIEAFRGMNVLTPTRYGDAFFTSAYKGTTELWEVGSDFAVAKQWGAKQQGYMSSPILIGDHAYLHLRNQRITCIDLKTGRETWTSEPFGKYQSMVANGDKILALDERKGLLLFKANPERFELLDQKKVSDSPTWAHLAVAGDELFVRALDAQIAFRWE